MVYAMNETSAEALHGNNNPHKLIISTILIHLNAHFKSNNKMYPRDVFENKRYLLKLPIKYSNMFITRCLVIPPVVGKGCIFLYDIIVVITLSHNQYVILI